uniref:PiggyBac transposable element-derived protein domain-containing protein n=1 Tax=Anopheles arabiensis TaxID=7173 RepID=A0A182HYY9_ANOAR
MSLQRFRSINRFIRFDDGRTREVRKEMDKSAGMSDIFAILNRNLQAYYVAGSYVTVDEQLYPYRGGTGFTQYIPSKPAKENQLSEQLTMPEIQRRSENVQIMRHFGPRSGVESMLGGPLMALSKKILLKM